MSFFFIQKESQSSNYSSAAFIEPFIKDDLKIVALNETGISVTVWPNDSICQNFKIKFATSGSLAPTALVSFPGSGNSWIRYLLESGSGVFTGSVYRDKIMAEKLRGELANFTDGSTLVQKTHHRAIFTDKTDHYDMGWRVNHVRQFVGGGILVIRNPYQAIISFWNWEKTNKHSIFASTKSFCSLEFSEFVYKSIGRWYELIEDWIQFGENVQITFYENLVQNPIIEIIKMFSYLKLPIDKARFKCLSRHLGGNFHRNNTLEVNPFTQEHHLMIKWAMEKINKTLFEKQRIHLPIYNLEFLKNDNCKVDQ